MATLAKFRTRIAMKTGIAADTSGSDDQALADDWINDGIVDVLLETHCNVDSQTVTPGASADYALSASVLAIIDMYTSSSGTDDRVEQVSVPDLLEMRRQGSTASSSPVTHYALAGADLILFYPTPAAADTFTMYYVPKPTALSGSADDPSSASLGGIRTEFHKAIEYYALAEAADYDDDTSSAQGARYREWYQAELSKVRRNLSRLGRYKPPPARLPTQRRPRRPRFSDQDWR